MPTSVLRFQDTHTRIGFHLLVCDIFLIYWPKAMRDFAITWCWLSYVHLLLKNHWSRYSNLSQIWAESSLWYLLSELCQMIARIIQHVWCYYKQNEGLNYKQIQSSHILLPNELKFKQQLHFREKDDICFPFCRHILHFADF